MAVDRSVAFASWHGGSAVKRDGGHRLSPVEAWFANLVIRRQGANPNQTGRRWLTNYGEGGFKLGAAAMILTLYAAALYFVALVMISVDDRGTFGHVGYALMIVAIFVSMFAMVRVFLASRTGRRFRGGKPFDKQTR
jgi:hypothetical protein